MAWFEELQSATNEILIEDQNICLQEQWWISKYTILRNALCSPSCFLYISDISDNFIPVLPSFPSISSPMQVFFSFLPSYNPSLSEVTRSNISYQLKTLSRRGERRAKLDLWTQDSREGGQSWELANVNSFCITRESKLKYNLN